MKKIIFSVLSLLCEAMSGQTVLLPDFRLIDSMGAADDRFGSSIDISADGQTAIIGVPFQQVGSYFQQGTAIIYERSGAEWIFQARLFDPGGLPTDYFGNGVAISADGNTVIVGAHGFYHNAHTDEGSAYVYVRNNGTWSLQAQFFGNNGLIGDNFGYTVDISADGNTALVGVFQDWLTPNDQAGWAYVYVRSGTTWSKQTELRVTNSIAGEGLGFSLALSGDGNTALLGARTAAVGKGYVAAFYRSGNTWTQQAVLTANDGLEGDLFGNSMSLGYDGNTALIGAPEKMIGSNAYQGTVYSFIRQGSLWSQEHQFFNLDAQPEDDFGRSVFLSDNAEWAVVGSSARNFGVKKYVGTSYFFHRENTAWEQVAELQPGPEAGANDFTGQTVVLSGDGRVGMASAKYNLVGSNGAQGCVWMYLLSELVPTKEPRMPESVKLYPTVSSGIVFADLDQPVNAARAVSVSGSNYLVPVSGNVLDLTKLNNGWYFLELKTANGVFGGQVMKVNN